MIRLAGRRFLVNRDALDVLLTFGTKLRWNYYERREPVNLANTVFTHCNRTVNPLQFLKVVAGGGIGPISPLPAE
jgi:hypothetical protein